MVSVLTEGLGLAQGQLVELRDAAPV